MSSRLNQNHVGSVVLNGNIISIIAVFKRMVNPVIEFSGQKRLITKR